MRLTNSLDLSALVTCHTLYVLLPSSQSAVFLLNSRLGRCAATPSGPTKQVRGSLPGYPFSRSYGADLPSSLTWLLSRTLGYSPRLPVSVCGTDPRVSSLRSFSWRCGLNQSRLSEDFQSLRPLSLTTGGFSFPVTLRPSPAPGTEAPGVSGF